MIARLEYNNTLAPVQEYGRHMNRLKNKKKKDVANDDDKQDRKITQLDEKYYDLDDGFIDDGDIQEQAGWEGMLANEGIMGDGSDIESELASSSMQVASNDQA